MRVGVFRNNAVGSVAITQVIMGELGGKGIVGTVELPWMLLHQL
jgi:hypothetical protein